MQAIEDIKPKPITVTDHTQIRKDIYYAGFRKGLWITGVISMAVFILFIFTHLYNWGFTVDLRDVAVIFSAGIVAVTCYYHAQNLRLNIEANQSKLDFDYNRFVFEQSQKKDEADKRKEADKKLYAYEICSNMVTPQMVIYVQRARVFYKTDGLMQELKKINASDDLALKDWSAKFDIHPARKAVILVLNYFEQIAVAINLGLADEETVRSLLKTVMLQYFKAYRSYIDFRQNDKIFGSATFMINYENLIKRWSNGEVK